MPDLNELASEIRSILNEIKDNTYGTRMNTTAISTKLSSIEDTNRAGFENLSEGIGVVIDHQRVANQLLTFNDAQNMTMICWLENIAKMLCTVQHLLGDDLELQKQIERHIDNIRKVLELVHSREAMEVAKHDELQGKVERCCPEREHRPEPCYEPCSSPRFEGPKEVATKWQAVKYSREKNK